MEIPWQGGSREPPDRRLGRTRQRWPLQAGAPPGARRCHRGAGSAAARAAGVTGGGPGRHRPVDTPGRGAGGRPRRPPRGGLDRHGQRQEPLLQPPGLRDAARRPQGEGPLPLPHQVPRPGPAPSHPGLCHPPGQRCHLRRRHAVRRAWSRAPLRPHRPVQPGHGALRDARYPHPLDGAVRPPRLRRGRRGPHAAGGVREPRRLHPAAAPAGRPPLRIGPEVHPHLGDHRQPGRPCRAPRRRPLHRGERGRQPPG